MGQKPSVNSSTDGIIPTAPDQSIEQDSDVDANHQAETDRDSVEEFDPNKTQQCTTPQQIKSKYRQSNIDLNDSTSVSLHNQTSPSHKLEKLRTVSPQSDKENISNMESLDSKTSESLCNTLGILESRPVSADLVELNIKKDAMSTEIDPAEKRAMYALSRELHVSLWEVTSLKELDLRQQKLTTLPPELSILCGLRVLDVRQNSLHSLGVQVCRLQGLTSLLASDNILTSISDVPLKPITHTSSIPSTMNAEMQLIRLDLSRNRLRQIPAEILTWPRLRTLLIAHNAVSLLPTNISQLSRLRHLDLGNLGPQRETYVNTVEYLPCSITELTCITRIDLAHNILTILPSGISALPNLIRMDLRHNRLSTIPHALPGPLQTKLARVQLAGNPIPDHELFAWSALRLSDSPISTTLPTTPPSSPPRSKVEDGQVTETSTTPQKKDSATDPAQKEFLYEGNSTDITPCLDLAARPQKISTSLILSISRSLASALCQVKVVILSRNNLICIPEEIALLRSLVELDLRHNRLTSLPFSLAHLSRLKTLQVSGNPSLSDPPRSICRAGAQSIQSYLSSRLSTLSKWTTVMGTHPLFIVDIEHYLNSEQGENQPMPDTLSPRESISSVGSMRNETQSCKNESRNSLGDGFNAQSPLTRTLLSHAAITPTPYLWDGLTPLEVSFLPENAMVITVSGPLSMSAPVLARSFHCLMQVTRPKCQIIHAKLESKRQSRLSSFSHGPQAGCGDESNVGIESIVLRGVSQNYVTPLVKSIQKHISSRDSKKTSVPYLYTHVSNYLSEIAQSQAVPIISYAQFAEYLALVDPSSSSEQVLDFLHSTGTIIWTKRFMTRNQSIRDSQVICNPLFLFTLLRKVFCTIQSINQLGAYPHAQLVAEFESSFTMETSAIFSLLRDIQVCFSIHGDVELFPCMLPTGIPPADCWPLDGFYRGVDFFATIQIPANLVCRQLYSSLLHLINSLSNNHASSAPPFFSGSHCVVEWEHPASRELDAAAKIRPSKQETKRTQIMLDSLPEHECLALYIRTWGTREFHLHYLHMMIDEIFHSKDKFPGLRSSLCVVCPLCISNGLLIQECGSVPYTNTYDCDSKIAYNGCLHNSRWADCLEGTNSDPSRQKSIPIQSPSPNMFWLEPTSRSEQQSKQKSISCGGHPLARLKNSGASSSKQDSKRKKDSNVDTKHGTDLVAKDKQRATQSESSDWKLRLLCDRPHGLHLVDHPGYQIPTEVDLFMANGAQVDTCLRLCQQQFCEGEFLSNPGNKFSQSDFSGRQSSISASSSKDTNHTKGGLLLENGTEGGSVSDQTSTSKKRGMVMESTTLANVTKRFKLARDEMIAKIALGPVMDANTTTGTVATSLVLQVDQAATFKEYLNPVTFPNHQTRWLCKDCQQIFHVTQHGARIVSHGFGKAGRLWKMSRRWKKWQERYFVLNTVQATLTRYRNEMQQSVESTYDLSKGFEISDVTEKTAPHTFRLIIEDSRMVTLKAASASDKMDWLKQLAIIPQLRGDQLQGNP